MKHHISSQAVANLLRAIQKLLKKVQFFTGDNNTQKMITSNETRITVAIADLIISEGLSFNLSQKPRFKKVLELEITVSKCYQHPNRKLISKDLLGVIHDKNMENNLILIEKESDIFGLLFLGDGDTLSRVPLLYIFVSGEKIPVVVLELVDCQGHLADGGKRNGIFICNIFLEHIKKLILTSQLQMFSFLMELQMFSLLVNC